MQKICAWCGKNIAKSVDTRPGVTHGMCADCEALLEGNQPGSLRHLLDKFDMPVMAVDKEGRVRTANGRVEEMLHKDLHEMENPLAGDFMECAYAQLPGGCGNTTHCPACTIRNTVMHTYNTGEAQTNVETTLNRRTADGITPVQLWITTVKTRDVVILRIEDMRKP
ncbi:hypothetical protein HQ585_08050 [candidate division KSB1 bacterium]|nr:hypothetical protein [candidate division KSB1 bacterium]